MDRKFKTQKAAVDHLVENGWSFSHRSIGDMVFKHPSKSFVNVIVALRRGWRIDAWGVAC